MIDEISFINHFLFHENRKKSDAGHVGFSTVSNGVNRQANSDINVKIVKFCIVNNARMSAKGIVLFGSKNGF
jgi:hypothetical protein